LFALTSVKIKGFLDRFATQAGKMPALSGLLHYLIYPL